MDINRKLDVFNVLNFLNSGYELDYILKEGSFGTFPSSKDCIDYLTSEGYLEGEDILKKYRVNDLKEILKENNLKVSGNKQELLKRAEPYLEKSDYKLTKKAVKLIDDNQWIDLYMFSLVMFDFKDFAKYYENSTGDMIQIALNFCDEVISRSLLSNNFLILLHALSAKSHVYAYDNDYETFLDYDLQRFILGLNPIIMDSKTYVDYEIVNSANIINIANVVDKFNFGSLRKRFNKIWVKSNIKDVTIPKKTAYNILQKAISGADISQLNHDLREKYFDKKFGIMSSNK